MVHSPLSPSLYLSPPSLQVPTSFLNKLTPAMRQWWTIKSENYDTILFFKVKERERESRREFYFMVHTRTHRLVNSMNCITWML